MLKFFQEASLNLLSLKKKSMEPFPPALAGGEVLSVAWALAQIPDCVTLA
jgi:hypothetical protein